MPSSPPPDLGPCASSGPTLTWPALGLLVAGADVTALFGLPPGAQAAARSRAGGAALGAGETDVRATEAGGDEVSSLARRSTGWPPSSKRARQRSRAADRARRQLLADVSHELMTPLTAMRGYLETLAMPDVALDEPTRRATSASSTEETHRLEAIIGDLLDLARLEGGGRDARVEDVSVDELFSRVCRSPRPALRDARSARSTWRPAAEDRGDAERLEQALQNLAANAIRHTPEAGRVSSR